MIRNIGLSVHLLGMAVLLAAPLASIAIGRYHALPDKAGLVREMEQLELRLVRRLSIDGAVVVILGAGLLLYANADWMTRGWVHAKLLLMLLATAALRDQVSALARLQTMRWSDDAGIPAEAYARLGRRARFSRAAALSLLLALAYVGVAKPSST